MVLRSVSLALSAAALCLAGSMTAAQVTPLTIEDIYSYEGWTRFNGSQAATMAWVPAGDPWLNDTEHLWPSDAAHSSAGAGEARGPWLRVDAASGASTPLYTYEQLERALAGAGVSSAEARNAARLRQANFNQARDALLITIGDDLYAFSISTRTSGSRDQLSRAEARGDVQPGRPQRRVRQEQQSVRGTSRRPRREEPSRRMAAPTS